jgi:hypothetical protein
MAKYVTHKNTNVIETLERKRIRAAKYAIETEKDRARALRSLASELSATVIPFPYVPSHDVELEHTANPNRRNVTLKDVLA